MNAIPTDAAAPTSAPVDVTPSDRLASRGARLGAALIDFFIHLSILSAIGAIAAGGFGAMYSVVQEITELRDLASIIAGYALYPLLHGYLLVTRGQTIGKLLCGIRIVRSDGRPANLGRILLIRWLPVSLVSLLGTVGGLLALADALCVFRASRQCAHDQLADTIVVRTEAPPLE